MNRQSPEHKQSELTPEQRARREFAETVMYWVAGVSIVGLILTEAMGWGMPPTRLVFMTGLAGAGTVALFLAAKRKCPNCGELYGYSPRVVRPNMCRHCGAESPIWDEP